jgi:hypothetical protein
MAGKGLNAFVLKAFNFRLPASSFIFASAFLPLRLPSLLVLKIYQAVFVKPGQSIWNAAGICVAAAPRGLTVGCRVSSQENGRAPATSACITRLTSPFCVAGDDRRCRKSVEVSNISGVSTLLTT